MELSRTNNPTVWSVPNLSPSAVGDDGASGASPVVTPPSCVARDCCCEAAPTPDPTAVPLWCIDLIDDDDNILLSAPPTKCVGTWGLLANCG